MTLNDILGDLPISAAHAWVMDHLAAPGEIFGAAKRLGITSEMLAEIVNYDFPFTVDAEMVENYFNLEGYDGSALSAKTEEVSRELVGTWVGLEYDSGTNIVEFTFDENGGFELYTAMANNEYDEIDGTEKGTYTWDAASGLLQTSLTVDGNGKLGLNGESATAVSNVDYDGAEYIKVSFGGESVDLYKVNNSEYSNDGIIGSWFAKDYDSGLNRTVLTLTDYGSYEIFQDVANEMGGEQDGSEYGAYSWNSATGEMVTTVDVDENGELGLNGATIQVNLVGAQLSVGFGGEAAFLFSPI